MAAFASYSPDGKKLAYNYIFREFRAWKRYQGGMADDIRVFDFNTKKSEADYRQRTAGRVPDVVTGREYYILYIRPG